VFALTNTDTAVLLYTCNKQHAHNTKPTHNKIPQFRSFKGFPSGVAQNSALTGCYTRDWAICSRCFEVPWCLHLQRYKCPSLILDILTVEPQETYGVSKTSGSDCPFVQRHIPEERKLTPLVLQIRLPTYLPTHIPTNPTYLLPTYPSSHLRIRIFLVYFTSQSAAGIIRVRMTE
jgi:hypothetical protein